MSHLSESVLLSRVLFCQVAPSLSADQGEPFLRLFLSVPVDASHVASPPDPDLGHSEPKETQAAHPQRQVSALLQSSPAVSSFV